MLQKPQKAQNLIVCDSGASELGRCLQGFGGMFLGPS